MIDSHCHLDFSHFDADRHTVWQRCQHLGVQQLVIPGIYAEQWPKAWALSQTLNGIVTSCGLHPYFIKQETVEQLKKQLIDFISQHKVAAIGECGLDKPSAVSLERQLALLQVQLELATEQQLPVILHVRGYHNELLQTLKRYPKLRGVIHGFSGSYELAKNYWQQGFYLGVGGTLTYPRAKKTQAAIKAMPIESLLLETDAPDMPLFGKQGQRNSPEYLPLIAESLAQLKNLPLATVIEQTSANTRTLFSL